jgi:hypothetical protein
MLALAIPQPSWWRGRGRAGDQIFLEEGAQGLHTWLIQRRQKPAERGAMGQAGSAEQRHERDGKGGKTTIKGLEGGFSRERISQHDRHKIDDLVAAKTSAGKAHVLLDRFQKTELGQHLSHHRYFTKPGRD